MGANRNCIGGQFRGLLLALILWLACVPAWGSLRDLPVFRVPDCVGVNTHFLTPQDGEMEKMHAGGFRVIRTDMVWERVERQPGEYDWQPYLNLTKIMRAHDMIPLYILDYSHSHYEEARSVVTQAGREAFARYAAQAVRELGDGPVIWEIWNEPNHPKFWVDQPSHEDYLKLVEAASNAMREVDPLCTIAAPATSEIDFAFLQQCFEGGLLDWIDVVSVHPYRHSHPETVLAEYERLRAMINEYSPGRFVPIISGEWGYSIYAYHEVDVDPQRQAQFFVRQILSNFIANVRVSIWYDWSNDGTDPEEIEHNFGVVDHALRPKPAYQAAKILYQQLSGLTFVTRLPTESPDDYLALFSNGAREVLAAWTSGEPHSIFLGVENDIGEATSMMGESVPLYRVGGEIELPLQPSPIYLHAERFDLVYD